MARICIVVLDLVSCCFVVLAYVLATTRTMGLQDRRSTIVVLDSSRYTRRKTTSAFVVYIVKDDVFLNIDRMVGRVVLISTAPSMSFESAKTLLSSGFHFSVAANDPVVLRIMSSSTMKHHL